MDSSLTIRAAFQMAASFLRKHEVDSSNFEAEWMLRRLLGVDRTRFFMIWNNPIGSNEYEQLIKWLERRVQNEPLQYIFGDQMFFGREFKVTPAVLIPRPETELLVETVIEEAKGIWGELPLHVVDIGTGSGCIAITLALECPHWHVTAIDLSPQALEVAHFNARKHSVDSRVHFKQGEYLLPLIQSAASLDILVSNPPYIPSEVVPTLEKQVSQYEPHLALDGGADGLQPYRILTNQIEQLPERPQLIAFEIGSDQGTEVAEMVRRVAKDVLVKPDFAGHDRIVIGRMPK
ncbi:peptide chain release factor N(5)-glutamine methyltransferase [Thermoflavimicrobium daqui]|jgi:release factor glutamine methyltransferase|uniref:Release factor glutamine methyltransferase n=1 Tax=Thermoflavimicrobium daqui TaxID=2137476 RepID=A0A364K3B6_9BACL|nr:peptide chain release factor N(5)-glutamine methyltransferase [Thermoflavimicrobium daqui]RAL23330.1 peptide chain release factor N(5)-glutamine methyltransferase [Thermoflavimicrobium daqui]